MKDFSEYFSRFIAGDPERLHFAAHSHHFWPDCSYDAHLRCWHDAATYVDDKWGPIFSQIIPAIQGHIARHLSLPSAETIAFAANTHEFVLRLHSAFATPPTILTTDAEFHSFHRQSLRWQEAGQAEVQTIAADPLPSFPERFLQAARAETHDLIYISKVFFNSGYVVSFLEELVDIVRDRKTVVVIDGYHGFMALPIDLSSIADRVFFIAGGYKYAMAGEGVCFMHCPPGALPRPVNTGWFAGFDGLQDAVHQVSYAKDGMRFWGATFDPSGMYRFLAVQEWLQSISTGPKEIHSHVATLQALFLDGVAKQGRNLGTLIPGDEAADRGHFITFCNPEAASLAKELAEKKVMVDVRGDRLRFGFAIYHRPQDIDELLRRLAS